MATRCGATARWGARPSPNASTCRLPSACSDEPSGAQSVFQSVAKRIATSVLLLSQVLVLRAAAGVCSARRLHARNAGHRPHRPLPRVARHRDRGHDLIGGRRSHVAIKRRIPWRHFQASPGNPSSPQVSKTGDRRRYGYRRSGIRNRLVWKSVFVKTYLDGSDPIDTLPCWRVRTSARLASAAYSKR